MNLNSVVDINKKYYTRYLKKIRSEDVNFVLIKAKETLIFNDSYLIY